MIATNEAVDVLRYGWQDAAATLAGDIPEVAELLQARLEIAIASDRLDERHLLDTIEEVESLSSRAGSPKSDTLALRLRRTVYEYLLALDAVLPGSAPPNAGAGSAVAEPTTAAATPSLAVVSADAEHASTSAEVAPPAAGHEDAAAVAAVAAAPHIDDDLEDPVAEDGDAVNDASVMPRRRFALRRRGRGDADEAAVEAEHEAAEDAAGAAIEDDAAASFVAPKAGFHIVDEDAAPDQAGTDTPMRMPAFASDEVAAGSAVPAQETAAAAATEEVAAAPTEDTGPSATDEFVPWRHAHDDRPLVAPLPGTVPDLSRPAVASAPRTKDAPTAAVERGADVAETTAAAPAEAMPEIVADAAGELARTPAAAAPDAEEEDDETRGWRIRRNGEPRRGRAGNAGQAVAEVEDDPFEGNAALTETRRRIEDRLRHKRCDEAAALLQGIAVEPGGRAIADLAMNAGDRCRALGKSNAALNCYLAASRSDPVYELPLSRLADVCIDDKETDLAVSYLERVARIYRYRGDDKGALRVYRRIATIAPYREDILTMLMAAQGTGRLES